MRRGQPLGLDELMIVNPSVQGIMEKAHLPLYDGFFVPNTCTFADRIGPEQSLDFFVDIQSKTRLETNLQSAGVLPHYNSYEVRAMRVIVAIPHARRLCLEDCRHILDKAVEFTRFRKREHRDVTGFRAFLEESLANLPGTATLALADLIYSSVTRLVVGEKVMIEMPTFWFPAGAGIFPGGGFVDHGEPDPTATFRFAEPVFIESRQSFRVEMVFPRGVPQHLATIPGPLRLWVVLDGYLTRDVQ